MGGPDLDDAWVQRHDLLPDVLQEGHQVRVLRERCVAGSSRGLLPSAQGQRILPAPAAASRKAGRPGAEAPQPLPHLEHGLAALHRAPVLLGVPALLAQLKAELKLHLRSPFFFFLQAAGP